MTLEEIKKKIEEGKAEFVQKEEKEEAPNTKLDEMAKFTTILEMLRKPKYHLTSAPTFIPKTFLEQIQFVDDGTNHRIYFYINGNWHYASLT